MEDAEIMRICNEHGEGVNYVDVGKVFGQERLPAEVVFPAFKRLVEARLKVDKAVASAFAEEMGLKREQVKKLLKDVEIDNHAADLRDMLHHDIPVTVREMEKMLSHALSQKRVRTLAENYFRHSANNNRALKVFLQRLRENREKDDVITAPLEELLPLIGYALEVRGIRNIVRLGPKHGEELLRARAYASKFFNGLIEDKARLWARRN